MSTCPAHAPLSPGLDPTECIDVELRKLLRGAESCGDELRPERCREVQPEMRGAERCGDELRPEMSCGLRREVQGGSP